MSPLQYKTEQSAIVIERLQKASLTLMALPRTGARLGIKVNDYGYVREIAEAHALDGWRAAVKDHGMRIPDPMAKEVDEMDDAFKWLSFIEGQHNRRIVAVRSITNYTTGRVIYSWRRIGDMFGASKFSCEEWYWKGIKDIVIGINKNGGM